MKQNTQSRITSHARTPLESYKNLTRTSQELDKSMQDGIKLKQEKKTKTWQSLISSGEAGAMSRAEGLGKRVDLEFPVLGSFLHLRFQPSWLRKGREVVMLQSSDLVRLWLASQGFSTFFGFACFVCFVGIPFDVFLFFWMMVFGSVLSGGTIHVRYRWERLLRS